jgi:hypothetical protein
MIKPTKYPYNPDEMAELFGEAVTQGRNGKQDTLVSGTNIKTINGTSVLGSGDLTVSSAAEWGSITGTLSSQTDLNTALNAKEPTITAGTTSQYYRGDKTFQTLDKISVGLGNVDNTSDANKPVSTGTQTALNGKQDTLVSGTNIKTLANTSLVGSGDISLKTINGAGLIGSSNIVIASSPYTLIGNQTGAYITNTTANTASTSQRIFPNTTANGNILQVRTKVYKINSTTSSTVRMYINTSNSLTGATLIATGTAMATVGIQSFWRDFLISSNQLYCYIPSGPSSSDITVGAMTLVSFNPAVDNYIIFAVQNSATADSVAFLKTNVMIYG